MAIDIKNILLGGERVTLECKKATKGVADFKNEVSADSLIDPVSGPINLTERPKLIRI